MLVFVIWNKKVLIQVLLTWLELLLKEIKPNLVELEALWKWLGNALYLTSAVYRPIERFCLSPLELEPAHVVLAAVREKELVLPVFIISSGKCSEFPVSSRAQSAAGRVLVHFPVVWPESSLYAGGGACFTCARDPFWYRGAVEELCCFWLVRGRWELNSKMSENMKKKFRNS